MFGGTFVAEVFFRYLTTPLGSMVVACTRRGVRFAAFGDDQDVLEAELRRMFPLAAPPRAESSECDLLDAASESALAALEGDRSACPPESVPVALVGTPFQHTVWTALRAIPAGETRTYANLASTIGSSTAARAVANACARNQAALFVPCHRVVRSDGGLGGFRWGVGWKRWLLEGEGAGPLSTHAASAS